MHWAVSFVCSVLLIFVTLGIGAPLQVNGLQVAVQNFEDDDGCTTSVLQAGQCTDDQISVFTNTSQASCQMASGDVDGFCTAWQASLDTAGYSVVAATEQTCIGFSVCISDPCYVALSVGNFALAVAYIGNKGPCDNKVFSMQSTKQ